MLLEAARDPCVIHRNNSGGERGSKGVKEIPTVSAPFKSVLAIVPRVNKTWPDMNGLLNGCFVIISESIHS